MSTNNMHDARIDLKNIILGGFLLIAASAVFGYELVHTSPQPVPIGCTQEAMQCPDGSYVGRTGPDCAFAPCPPGIPILDENYIPPPISTDDWQEYSSSEFGFAIKYPQGWHLNILDVSEGILKVANKPLESYYAGEFGDLLLPRDGMEVLVEKKQCTAEEFQYNGERFGVLSYPDFRLRESIICRGDFKITLTVDVDAEYKGMDILEMVAHTFRDLSWKTYRNEEYGFEFRYPSDWEVGGKLKLNTTVFFTGSMGDMGDVGGDQIDFEVSSNTANLTLGNWIQENIGFEGVDRTIVVYNITGIKRVGQSEISGEQAVVIFLPSDGKVFSFAAVGQKNMAVLTQMLSTFKFIK